MADIFDVIADGTRRDILQVLRERSDEEVPGNESGTSVSEIVAHLSLSQPTVSKHLKVLRDAGLVTVREEGQHRYYSIDAVPLEEIEDWLVPFLGLDYSLIVQPTVLPEQARIVAGTVGKVAADTSFAVASAVHAVRKKFRQD